MQISGFLKRHAKYKPQHTAVICDDLRFNYDELSNRVNRLGNLMMSHGVRKGDRVATVLPNCIELYEVYWASAAIGAVVIPLSPLLQENGLISLLQDAKPALVFGSAKNLNALTPVRERVQSVKPQGWILTDEKVEGWSYLPEMRSAASAEASSITVTPEDVYNIMYTSGTTGLPKGIIHTQRVRAAYASLFAHTWRMKPESVVLQTGAIVFNGAFVNMMPCMMLGGTYILHKQFDPAAFIETVAKEKVTHVMLVPTQIIAVLNAPEFEPVKLKSLEMILSLGAPLHVEHKTILEAALPNRFYELYGLTEGFATILDRDDAVRKRGSVGVPLAFSEIKIIGKDGVQMSAGEVGEIVGRAPIMMSGYYNLPELTAQVLKDGWLSTGDLGYLDEDGYLFLVDRKKDMINSGGVKVYPKDIEEIAVTHPAVSQAAVFGIPDPKWGEVPVAAIVLREKGSNTVEGLKIWINEKVAAKYQRVSDVIILDSLPTNVAGKVLKKDLRERYSRSSSDQITH